MVKSASSLRSSSSGGSTNSPSSPPSKYPLKPLPTLSTTHTDAQSYLAALSRRATRSTPSIPSTSASSIVSYESSVRPRSSSASTAIYSETSSEHDDDEPPTRAQGWKGLNSPMPLPSGVSATRGPTRVFDKDFTPNPEDPYSLRCVLWLSSFSWFRQGADGLLSRHSEYGYDPDPAHRTTSKHTPGYSLLASDEEPSIWIYFGTYLSCTCWILLLKHDI